MKIDREAPIGVFDSGVGGLTVAREIMRNLPSEKIVYFGDTARVPYGSKSKETIIRYSRQIIRFLQQQQVKAIVVACNTASAFALDAVRDEFDIPIIGVIEPGAKVAAAQTRNKGRNHWYCGNCRKWDTCRVFEASGSGDHCFRQSMSAVCATGRRRVAS